MKENNGRAATERRQKQYLVGCLLTTILLFVWWYSWLGDHTSHNYHNDRYNDYMSHATNNNNNNNNNNNSKNRHALFREQFFSSQNKNLRHDDRDESSSLLEQAVVQGELQLIDLKTNLGVAERLAHQYNNNKANNNQKDHVDYTGLFRASFCRLDWSSHEQDPSLTPMFRDVVTYSKCKEYGTTLDLYQVVQAARAYHPTPPQENLQPEKAHDHDHDEHNSFQSPVVASVHVLPLQGVVFHESRCGSTLVANLLQWHNPVENVVYSESPPPIAVLNTLGPYLEDNNNDNDNDVDNHNHWTAQVLRDVMFLMSRTTNPHKRRVFFKIQSMGSWNLHLFRAAFGGVHHHRHQSVPWIYVYRDPVEVLMSHLKGGRQANCVRSQRSRSTTPPQLQRVLETYTPGAQPRALSLPDYCAAHLASLTETAVHELIVTTTTTARHHQGHVTINGGGIAVNYRSLPKALVDWIWPKVWNLTLDAEALQRIQAGSQSYSKGRGMRAQQQFVGDSQAKQEQASPEVKQAAHTYLEPSFQALERLAATAALQYHQPRHQQHEAQGNVEEVE